MGFPCGSAGKESASNARDLGSIPGLGRSPRKGKGYPLQYSSLENSMDYTVSAEKAMTPNSSTLVWKIPWLEEPGRLQSMGLLRVGHDWVIAFSLFTSHFHALEKEMATHSSVLAWRILGTGEPGGLLSVELHRVRHNWSDLAAAAAYSPWVEKSRKQWATFTVIESFMQNPSH